MGLAFHWASFSKDINTKVGAVFVSKDLYQIICGYNGFPREEPDDNRLYTDEKNKIMIHAEHNVIKNIRNIDTTDGYLFTTKACCFECSELICNKTKITTIFSKPIDCGKWRESQLKALDNFKKNNISVFFI